MIAQPFADPSIYEVTAAQIAVSHSTGCITFSDATGIHRFYVDYHPGYAPMTLFVREGEAVRPRIVWAHPTRSTESDY